MVVCAVRPLCPVHAPVLFHAGIQTVVHDLRGVVSGLADRRDGDHHPDAEDGGIGVTRSRQNRPKTTYNRLDAEGNHWEIHIRGGAMLLQATIAVTLVGMATTLWMGFYLFARGFPSPMTLRVVILMLALSGFFHGAYKNIFEQIHGSAAIRAVLLVVVQSGVVQRDLSGDVSERDQKRFRWIEWGIYALAGLTVAFLLQPSAFILEQGNALHVAHMNPQGLAYRIYGGYQLIISFAIMFNLLAGDRVGLTSRGKYFLATSIFPVVNIFYGVISLASPAPAPRIIQDTLAFCGVFVLGLSVARHQSLTERRSTLQEFPLTTLFTLGLAALAGFLALRLGVALPLLADVVGFVIILVGLYDLTREFLERLRLRNENQFRKQLRQLEHDASGDETLHRRLQEGLDLLCQTLKAPGGFVAICRGENFVVTATRSSVDAGSEIAASLLDCEDVSHPKAGQPPGIAWIAPSFEGQTQVAIVGIGSPEYKLDYASGDLALLEEVADQVGTLVSLSNQRSKQDDTLPVPAVDNMLDTISAYPDIDFIKIVEDSLRRLPDVVTLGQSPLAEKLGIQGELHVERGKRFRNC